MKYLVAGFVVAVRLFVGLLFLALIIPPTALGLLIGILWQSFLVGYRSEKELLDWLVGEGRAWKMKIDIDYDATKESK